MGADAYGRVSLCISLFSLLTLKNVRVGANAYRRAYRSVFTEVYLHGIVFRWNLYFRMLEWDGKVSMQRKTLKLINCRF